MIKLEDFLVRPYRSGSYFFVLQRFMRERMDEGLSAPSLTHLHYSLFPLGEVLGNPPIGEVDRAEVAAYVDELWLQYAASTIRGHVGDIQQFSRWCVHRDLCGDFSKRLRKPRGRARRGYVPSDEEVLVVIRSLRRDLGDLVDRNVFGVLEVRDQDAVDDESRRLIRDLFILAFLYETGARVGELVMMPRRVMEFAVSSAVDGVGCVTLRGKTGDRDYWLTHYTMELWELWKRVRVDVSLYAVVGWRRGEKPRRLLPNGVSQMLYRRSAEVGRGFRAHALRHAKARRARRVAGLEMAQFLLDHSSQSMTAAYAGPETGEVTSAARRSGLPDLWAG